MALQPVQDGHRLSAITDMNARLEQVVLEIADTFAGNNSTLALRSQVRRLSLIKLAKRDDIPGWGDLAVLLERAFPEDGVDVWAGLLLDEDELARSTSGDHRG